MQANLIYFTRYDTIISGFYGELPTQQFFEKFEKGIGTNKFESAKFNDDTYSSASSNHYSICSIMFKATCRRYYLITEKEIKQDLENHIATNDTIKIYKFLKLLETQKKLDKIAGDEEYRKKSLQFENERKEYLITLADQGIIESEEAKELYLEHLKKNSTFFKILCQYFKEAYKKNDTIYTDDSYTFKSIYVVLFPILFPKKYIASLKLNSHKIAAIMGKDYPKIEESSKIISLTESCEIEEKVPVLITDAIISQIRNTYILTKYINEIDKARIQAILDNLIIEYLQKKYNLNKDNNIVLETLALKRYIVDRLVDIEIEIFDISRRDIDFNQATAAFGEQLSWQLKK